MKSPLSPRAQEARSTGDDVEPGRDGLPADVQERLQARLEARRDALHGEVQEGNERRTGDDDFAAMASEVPDAGDASAASVQIDVRHAEIDRDIGEVRAVEAALARMADGSYGECTMCGQPIPLARLEVEPAAERCVHCQGLLEARQHAITGSTL